MDPSDGGPGSGVQEEYDAVGYEQTGDALPPFASDQAKEIDKEVKVGESELEDMGFHIDENSERVKVMAEHLTNVQQVGVHSLLTEGEGV